MPDGRRTPRVFYPHSFPTQKKRLCQYDYRHTNGELFSSSPRHWIGLKLSTSGRLSAENDKVMRMNAYIGNPVIATQEQYYQQEELLHEINPDCKMVQLRQDVVIIENIARRTFHYPRSPSIEGWLVGCNIWSKMGYKCLQRRL